MSEDHSSKVSKAFVLGGGLTVLALALFVVGQGLYTRQSDAQNLESKASKLNVPTVIISLPTQSNKIGQNDASITVDLPGRLEAFSKASLFARVSGYLVLSCSSHRSTSEWSSAHSMPKRGRNVQIRGTT